MINRSPASPALPPVAGPRAGRLAVRRRRRRAPAVAGGGMDERVNSQSERMTVGLQNLLGRAKGSPPPEEARKANVWGARCSWKGSGTDNGLDRYIREHL